jgi:hypothetical protein
VGLSGSSCNLPDRAGDVGDAPRYMLAVSIQGRGGRHSCEEPGYFDCKGQEARTGVTSYGRCVGACCPAHHGRFAGHIDAPLISSKSIRSSYSLINHTPSSTTHPKQQQDAAHAFRRPTTTQLLRHQISTLPSLLSTHLRPWHRRPSPPLTSRPIQHRHPLPFLPLPIPPHPIP